MNVIAYSVRPDEHFGFNRFAKELDCNVTYINECLSMENVDKAKGYEYVTILGNCDASRQVLERLAANGVKYLASRSAGYNNIDVMAARDFNIGISNAMYSPHCVADFTTMLMLMSIRKVKHALQRSACQDFSLGGIQGREMRNLTVGVIGTGRIGQAVIKNISGFGCKILAYDLYPNKEMEDFVEYVSLEKLYEEADMITIHSPLVESTYHLIDAQAISKMKDNVILINTARGELIHTKALIDGLSSGKIGAAGLDVIEGEVGIFHEDRRHNQIDHPDISILKQMPNVVLTHHFAFYTDQAVDDMIECGLRSLYAFHNKDINPYEIKN